MAPKRQPYSGTRRKLVLAFDLGTTFSGVSYSILDPGLVPQIQGVTRYPSQENVGGNAKIPSVIRYDNRGVVKAVGSETLTEEDWDECDDMQSASFLAKWFKLHLRQGHPETNQISKPLPPLPATKTVVEVFADFFAYLFQCTKTYITETVPSGERFWSSIVNDIEFVLSHPNGWGGAEQARMREACQMAGLIPNTQSGGERVKFVTEGEASLHFCVQNGLETAISEGVIIIDAGGGTLDISSYTTNGPNSFEEIAPPQYSFDGSIWVTTQAEEYFRNLLRGTKYESDIDNIVQIFDSSTKLRCKNPTDPIFIKFGRPADKDDALGIRGGQLKIPGAVVATFFEPSLRAMKDAIEQQLASASRPITSVFLVGGFGASEYIFSRLKLFLDGKSIKLCRPDTHLNKAVASGAVSFYLDHSVSARVARQTYGIECSVPAVTGNPQHDARNNHGSRWPNGQWMLPKAFDVILAKNTVVSEATEFRRAFYRTFTSSAPPATVTSTILCYSGDSPARPWTDVNPGLYSTLCTIEADTSRVVLKHNAEGGSKTRKHTAYWSFTYDIILHFGLSELKAQYAWKDSSGVEKRGPAKVVYGTV